MATATYELTTNIWRRISAAGESGTCWILALSGNVCIFINHTVTPGAGPPDTIAVGSQAEIDAGLNNHENAFPLGVDDRAISIPVDDVNDVYYALFIDNRPNDPGSAKINADVI